MAEKDDLMKLDFYDLLKIAPNANTAEIKKAFRKRAVLCHPDKNPDNPDAAAKFDQLKKILEILLDVDKKKTYDKLLGGRKQAEIRARNVSAKARKLKDNLDRREELAKCNNKRNDFRDDSRTRISEENRRYFEEEIANFEKEMKEEGVERKESPAKETEASFRVKAKWKKTQDWQGFTKDEVQRIFYKWGEMNAIAMTETESKGTALIEYAEKSGAEMAVAYEKGLPGKSIEVRYITNTKKTTKETTTKNDVKSEHELSWRRAEERKKLIEDLLKSESNMQNS